MQDKNLTHLTQTKVAGILLSQENWNKIKLTSRVMRVTREHMKNSHLHNPSDVFINTDSLFVITFQHHTLLSNCTYRR